MRSRGGRGAVYIMAQLRSWGGVIAGLRPKGHLFRLSTGVLKEVAAKTKDLKPDDLEKYLKQIDEVDRLRRSIRAFRQTLPLIPASSMHGFRPCPRSDVYVPVVCPQRIALFGRD